MNIKRIIVFIALLVGLISIYICCLVSYNGVNVKVINNNPLKLKIWQYGLKPHGVHSVTFFDDETVLWRFGSNFAYKNNEDSSYLDFSFNYGVLPDGFFTEIPTVVLPEGKNIRLVIYYDAEMPFLAMASNEFLLRYTSGGAYVAEVLNK